MFYQYAAILSGVSFPVIYTFPISLSYDARYSALEGYFITKTLPMIKIETIGWIINQSEQGLFLVIAEEGEQQEIKRVYRNSKVRIFDYKRRGEIHYSFERFRKDISILQSVITI